MNSKQLTIRVGNNTLSFMISDKANPEEPVMFEPYVVKSGISMAANLREAFKTFAREIDFPAVRVLINAPVLMVPIEQFQEADAATLYLHAYPRSEKEVSTISRSLLIEYTQTAFSDGSTLNFTTSFSLLGKACR